MSAEEKKEVPKNECAEEGKEKKDYHKPVIKSVGDKDIKKAVKEGSHFPSRGFAG